MFFNITVVLPNYPQVLDYSHRSVY